MADSPQKNDRLTLRSVACTFCRKRKRKCNGQQPCSMCIRYNRAGSCEFHVDQDRRKWKFDSTHVDYLELKLDIFENLANELVNSDPEKARRIMDAMPEARKVSLAKVEMAVKESTASDGIVKGLADCGAIEEMISTKWTVRQDENGVTEYYGPISGRGQVLENVENQQPSNIPGYRLETLLSSRKFRLKLFENFKQSFAQYFYGSWLSIDDIKSWEFPSSDITQRLLVAAVLTYGAVFDSDPELPNSIFQEAQSLVMDASKEVNENVIQALLIFSCFELGMARDSNAWALDAMCSACTQYLKLHSVDDQKRTKSLALFWSVIIQDRMITSVLGRGCRIQYFRVRTPFLEPPSNTQVSDNTICELTFALHSKLWFIHDRFLSQIYSNKAEFLHSSHRLALINHGIDAVKNIQESLPHSVRLTDLTADCRILTLHLSFSVTYLLFHRAYLKQIPLKVIHTITEQCEISSPIITKLSQTCELHSIPHFASYLVLTCATFDMFLLTNKHQNPSFISSSMSRVQTCIEGLRKIGRYWKRGTKDIYVLSELAKRWGVDVPFLDQTMKEMQHTDSEAFVGLTGFEHLYDGFLGNMYEFDPIV